MLILNCTYPIRCLRVPPVEYHWFSSQYHSWVLRKIGRKLYLFAVFYLSRHDIASVTTWIEILKAK
jgi:hypothetical protein